MCAVISRGYTFGSTEQVTNAKLHALVDDAVISGIVNADISDGANIDFDKIAGGTIDGGNLTGLGNVTPSAGILPVANGSTGLGACALGDILYASATNVWARLARSTTATRYLANTGASNIPQWDQVNLANGVTGVLPIANGGTGQTTAQTAIDALLPSQTGNSGKFLTTNGSTSSWGEGLGKQLFTSSGTFTAPAGVTNIWVSMVGGGGGGGSGHANGGGAGGGAGAYGVKMRLRVIAETAYTVTVGSGGAGGTFAGSGDGGNGGTTSIVGADYTLSALGGTGGENGYGGGADATGGAGGVGNMNGGNAGISVGTAGGQTTTGGNGGNGKYGDTGHSGGGGGNPFGMGAVGVDQDTVGNNATGYGGGGSGGGYGGYNRVGGAGANGVCLVEW
jgi:hypothetical protein